MFRNLRLYSFLISSITDNLTKLLYVELFLNLQNRKMLDCISMPQKLLHNYFDYFVNCIRKLKVIYC